MTHIEELDTFLKEMSNKINHEACNYVLSVRLFKSDNASSLYEVIKELYERGSLNSSMNFLFDGSDAGGRLLHDEIFRGEVVSQHQLIDAMTDALTFIDHDPSRYMNTDQHKSDLSTAKKLMFSLFFHHERVVKFSFPWGLHPFHPIYYDHTYAVWFEDCVVVFIASASD